MWERLSAEGPPAGAQGTVGCGVGHHGNPSRPLSRGLGKLVVLLPEKVFEEASVWI